MKDIALAIAAQQEKRNDKLNVLREYLQAFILRILHDKGFFSNAAFVGGTALRFLFQLPRYSEDLDFSIITPEKSFSFAGLLRRVKTELEYSGYDAAVTYNDEKNVNHAFVKFGGILKDAGLSPLKEQKLSIKIELDTKPPEGAKSDTAVVNKHFPLVLVTYDKSSLFAGKIHAVLSRKYTKGRDIFDIGWYLSKWNTLEPNYKFLGNALIQTGWKRKLPDRNTWKQYLTDVIKETEWKTVSEDVENFLERPADKNVFSRETLLKLLKKG